jgi:hypothetical protein
MPDPDGIICSRMFPGLWLAIADLLDQRMNQVLDTLQTGLRSPEHQAFLAQLTQR